MKPQSTIPLDQRRARSIGTATDELSAGYLDEIRALREENKRLREKHEISLAREIISEPKPDPWMRLGWEGE